MVKEFVNGDYCDCDDPIERNFLELCDRVIASKEPEKIEVVTTQKEDAFTRFLLELFVALINWYIDNTLKPKLTITNDLTIKVVNLDEKYAETARSLHIKVKGEQTLSREYKTINLS